MWYTASEPSPWVLSSPTSTHGALLHQWQAPRARSQPVHSGVRWSGCHCPPGTRIAAKHWPLATSVSHQLPVSRPQSTHGLANTFTAVITVAASILRHHLLTLRNGRQTRTRALVLPTRACRCCELERGVLCEAHATNTPATAPFCARCRSVHVACVACGGAGGVCEASSEVYERMRVCTDRKGGWGSGTYQPTSAVTPQQPWHQLSLLAPKRGTLDRLYN